MAEEESESNSSGFGRGNSRQSSLTSSAEEKKLRKRQRLFKGLGTMFRFGKNRKSLESPIPPMDDPSLDASDSTKRLNQSINQQQYRKTPDLVSHRVLFFF